MHDAGRRDLAWWSLGEQFVSRSLAAIVGVAAGGLGWLGLQLPSTVEPTANDDAASVATLIGLVAGVIWWMSYNRLPRRLAPPWQGSFSKIVRRLAIWASIVTLPATLGGFTVALTLLLPSADIIDSTARGIIDLMPPLAVLAAALGTHVWLSAPPERAAQLSPRLLLEQDRASALITALAAGIVGCVVVLPMVTLSDVLEDIVKAFSLPRNADEVDSSNIFETFYLNLRAWEGLVYVPAYSFLTAACVLLMRAWPKFVVARLALAARRRLPLRLVAFLDDARERELLRQVGGAYQFRHARLQERLIVRQVNPSPARRKTRAGLLQQVAISALVATALVTAVVVGVTGNQSRCAAAWSLSSQTRLQRLPLGETYECVGILEADEVYRLGRPPGPDRLGFRPAYEMILGTNAAAVNDPRHRSVVLSAHGAARTSRTRPHSSEISARSRSPNGNCYGQDVRYG